MEIRLKGLYGLDKFLVALLLLLLSFLLGFNYGIKKGVELVDGGYSYLLGIQEDIAFIRLLEEIVQRESNGIHEAVGGDEEYGWCQFKESTFYWLATLAGLEGPDWKNEEQQVWLLAWAVKNGYGDLWTTYVGLKEEVLGGSDE